MCFGGSPLTSLVVAPNSQTSLLETVKTELWMLCYFHIDVQ